MQANTTSYGTISLAIIDRRGVEVEFVGSLVGSSLLSTAVPSLAATMQLLSSRYKFVLGRICVKSMTISVLYNLLFIPNFSKGTDL